MANYIGINTERLFLRSIKPDDAVAIFKYRSDSITNKYQGWIPKTINDVHDFIESKISTSIDINNTWYQFGIILIENLEFIGDVGIHFLDGDSKQVELGCTLDRNYHGKGMATEALTRILNYAFNDLDKHRAVTSIDLENIKSIALVERLGFRKEVHFTERIPMNLKWPDDLYYSILKEEWICRERTNA
jgi:RimJ/RimL family protein N-acetyltransferase